MFGEIKILRYLNQSFPPKRLNGGKISTHA